MPNVQLFDMKDILDCNRVRCICSNAGPKCVCCQTLQVAVSGHCLHEVSLQRMCRSVCFQALAIPALHPERISCNTRHSLRSIIKSGGLQHPKTAYMKYLAEHVCLLPSSCQASPASAALSEGAPRDPRRIVHPASCSRQSHIYSRTSVRMEDSLQFL